MDISLIARLTSYAVASPGQCPPRQHLSLAFSYDQLGWTLRVDEHLNNCRRNRSLGSMAARGTSAQALFPSSVILTHVFAGNGRRGILCSALVVSDTLMRHGKDASSAEHELWEVAGKDARKDDSFWARQMGSGQ